MASSSAACALGGVVPGPPVVTGAAVCCGLGCSSRCVHGCTKVLVTHRYASRTQPFAASLFQSKQKGKEDRAYLHQEGHVRGGGWEVVELEGEVG